MAVCEQLPTVERYQQRFARVLAHIEANSETALSLDELSAGFGARVVRVSDDDPEMLRYLAELEIVPGAELLVISRAPYQGPISLKISGHLLSIGPQLASQVMVEPLANPDAPSH